jgi:hypothetical protein
VKLRPATAGGYPQGAGCVATWATRTDVATALLAGHGRKLSRRKLAPVALSEATERGGTGLEGERVITGADIHAQLRHLGPGAYEAELAEAWIPADARFVSVEQVEQACPPERIGLSPGGFAALLGPLFGEFE